MLQYSQSLLSFGYHFPPTLPTDLTIGIAGSGGDGVILLGELLARSAASAGLHATLVKSFGPQIRGGETSARVLARVSAA